MKWSIIAPSELTFELSTQWDGLRALDPNLISPFFSADYVRHMGRFRPRGRVALLEDCGELKAGFPFETAHKGTLSPLGSFLADYQGIISSAESSPSEGELLRACSAYRFLFKNIPISQPTFAGHFRKFQISPLMNLEGGWQAYVERLGIAQDTQSPGVLRQVRQSVRQIERDIGPLRFTSHSRSMSDFSKLISLKREQWLKGPYATGTTAFDIPWVFDWLNFLLDSPRDGFFGQFSTLHSGDNLVACHLGVRSGKSMHYWFPVYDPSYAKYCPGLILLQRLAEHSASDGITTIDLGGGAQPYKLRFATGHCQLGSGSVTRPNWLAKVEWGLRDLKARLIAN